MDKTSRVKARIVYLNKLMVQARDGDGVAACKLGDIYRDGNGMEQSWEEAFRWYTLGARTGNADAQNNLGTLYLEGFYCPQDYQQAVYWYRKSAEQGISVAQYNLGMRYIHGQGVPADYAEAMRWLELSADQHYNLANHDLGIMHLHGEGCTPDPVKALRYLMKGAVHGDDRAITSLAEKLPEMEEMAIEGDFDDWLALSDLHYDRLNLPDSQARGWAWLLWAEAHPDTCGSLERGAACWLKDVMTDMDMRGGTAQADRKKGQKLFKAMMHERAIAVPPKPAPDAVESNGSANSLWHEACDANAPTEKRFGDTQPGDELVLQLCAEGGGLDLFGRRGSDGAWSFWCGLDDWTPIMEDDPAISRASGMAHSWDAAIASLDRMCNHWMSLYPTFVHPEFRKPLLALVERRLIVNRLVGMGE